VRKRVYIDAKLYTISTTLRDEDIERIDHVADQQGVCRAEWMRRVLVEALDQEEQMSFRCQKCSKAQPLRACPHRVVMKRRTVENWQGKEHQQIAEEQDWCDDCYENQGGE
jgi:hypothetical protein